MNLKPIMDEPDLKRDLKTGSVVQTNEEAYRAYVKTRNRTANLESQVQSLTGTVEELKKLVESLIRNGNK